MIQMRLLPTLLVTGLLAGLLVGCGSPEPEATPDTTGQTAPTETNAVGKVKTAANTLPTASISQPEPAQSADESAAGIIKQITNVMRQPLASSSGTPDPKQVPQLIKARNKKIVDLASKGVLVAHQNQEPEEIMHQLVQRLSEARLQLALQGDQSEGESLYADAEYLQKQRPGSKSAMEASYAVVRFANTNAMRYSQKNTEWITEFARQARTFCEAFPEEKVKTMPLLLAAGRSCERYKLSEEARMCYAQILAQYPDTPQGEQSKGVLRRLSLTGQSLKFGGSTYQGEFFKIEQNRGKVTAIVYWSSNIGGIEEVLTEIDSIAGQFDASKLEVVGVSLDDDELPLEIAVGNAGIAWKQLFDPDPTKRSWQHPVVKYYGVLNVPSIWLIDQNGMVVSTSVSEKDLTAELTKLIK
ncbi:hypothetical protein Pla110_16160 [Polystyrenella longa]|uniref:Thiol-disulfide oxidoreductase n=1 Tax=Polystyrenella longa TaxID=2528007 RepID=A0A518CL05_9PLAN|nr:hypothetical protein [Polystyrenella longa]QDU79896.1 hypothetical protein Pla110_16160 [Polystyrenella longa]